MMLCFTGFEKDFSNNWTGRSYFGCWFSLPPEMSLDVYLEIKGRPSG